MCDFFDVWPLVGWDGFSFLSARKCVTNQKCEVFSVTINKQERFQDDWRFISFLCPSAELSGRKNRPPTPPFQAWLTKRSFIQLTRNRIHFWEITQTHPLPFLAIMVPSLL
jgi:hypothetical protein